MSRSIHTRLLRSAAAALALLLAAGPSILHAQTHTKDGGSSVVDGMVEFDKTVHDFGDIMLTDGPVGCKFTLKNISSKPVAINSVASSCGCTNVTWTKEPILPGKTGTIQATFSNDQGAYPFDKTLTVSVAGLSKQVVLRLRGTVHEKKKPLGEMYPVHIGDLGLKSTDIKLGNLTQGSDRGDAVFVANLGKTPLSVSFKDVSAGLQIEVSPNPVPAGQTAKLSYTVATSRDKWGKNYYYATPVVGGRTYARDRIGIWAFTKEDFSSVTAAQKERAARPMAAASTFNFDTVKSGTQIDATFEIRNDGKEELVIYKVDTDHPAATLVGQAPRLAPGAKTRLTIHLDTGKVPSGEFLGIVTVTTNSPIRPLMNLFIAGQVK